MTKPDGNTVDVRLDESYNLVVVEGDTEDAAEAPAEPGEDPARGRGQRPSRRALVGALVHPDGWRTLPVRGHARHRRVPGQARPVRRARRGGDGALGGPRGDRVLRGRSGRSSARERGRPTRCGSSAPGPSSCWTRVGCSTCSGEGEPFGHPWMLSGLPTGWEARARESSLCYRLAADDVIPLLANPAGPRSMARALMERPRPGGPPTCATEGLDTSQEPARTLIRNSRWSANPASRCGRLPPGWRPRG